MIITTDLLNLLRCPETGQTLSLAHASLLARANARDLEPKEELRANSKPSITERLTAALVREDQTLLYPVRNGIPVLLIEEAILL